MRHATKARFARWAALVIEARHARQVRCYANAPLLSGLAGRRARRICGCSPNCWYDLGLSYGGTSDD